MREADIVGLKELFICYLRVRAIAILRLAFKDHVKVSPRTSHVGTCIHIAPLRKPWLDLLKTRIVILR